MLTTPIASDPHARQEKIFQSMSIHRLAVCNHAYRQTVELQAIEVGYIQSGMCRCIDSKGRLKMRLCTAQLVG